MREAELEKACIELAEKSGFMVFRPSKFWSKNNGRRKNDLGAPDLFIFHDGVATAVELKVGSGVQSGDQLAFEARLYQAGIKYFVVKTLDEFGAILEDL